VTPRFDAVYDEAQATLVEELASQEPDARVRADQLGRRAGTRSRSLLGCRVVYDEAFLTVEAVVRNIDRGGCMVRLSTEILLPPVAWLLISRRDIAHRVRIAWRNGRDLGLAFLEEVSLSEPITADAKMLRRIWLGTAERIESVDRFGWRLTGEDLD
jgi:hypothetical protein